MADNMFLETNAEYTWCFHCERAHATAKWEANDWDCPDPECDGGAFDAHPWALDHWPRNAHPEYPEIPEMGKDYPLYD